MGFLVLGGSRGGGGAGDAGIDCWSSLSLAEICHLSMLGRRVSVLLADAAVDAAVSVLLCCYTGYCCDDADADTSSNETMLLRCC